MIIEFQHPIGPGLTLVCEIDYYPADPGNLTLSPGLAAHQSQNKPFSALQNCMVLT